MTVAIFLAAVGLPLGLALGLIWPAMRPIIWRMLPIAPVPALALALLLPDLPVSGEGAWLILGMMLGMDDLSRIFVILTALLWIAAGSAARQWVKEDAHATGFGVSFLMAMCGNLGLLMAQDALSFYAFFALMSFASFGLVIHTRAPAAQAAGYLYISFVVMGELTLFAGLALASAETGSLMLADLRAAPLSDLPVALLIAGFGVKLGIMPLHFWLPPAHGAAPAPASAVLSGAMIKAGLFGMIMTLPLGAVAYTDHATVLLAAGLVTIFAALLLGVQAADAKTVLGYSSVSQMGILALGLGAGLMVPAAWPVILPVLLFLALHHGFAKGALFLGAAAFATQPGRVGRIVVTLLLLVPALVLAGLPLTSGAIGKEALKSALAQGPVVWLPWLTVALTLSGIATTLLMARFVALLWVLPPKAPPQARPEALVQPFLGLAGLALFLPLAWPVLVPTMAGTVDAAKPGVLWPVALGTGIAMAAAIRAHALRIGPVRFVDQLARPFRTLAALADDFVAAKRRALRRLASAVPRQMADTADAWRLGQTAVVGLIALVLLVELTALAGHPDDAPRPPADTSAPGMRGPGPAASTFSPR